MVSNTVLNDIFNIEFKPTDVHLDHISDELEDFGFAVGEVANYDTSVYISFSLPSLGMADLSANLVINRMEKSFEVEANLEFRSINHKDKSTRYISAVSKDFGEIEKYLRLLKVDCMQYVESVCIEINSYSWHGLNFRAPA